MLSCVELGENKFTFSQMLQWFVLYTYIHSIKKSGLIHIHCKQEFVTSNVFIGVTNAYTIRKF